MRERNPSRNEALEEYLIYRKRVRELLDIAQIAIDIKEGKYRPQDILGRGPDRFSETLGDVIIGLFGSFFDPSRHALNVFEVWVALFPDKKGEIEETWDKIAPYIQPIRNYRNDVVAHANKNPRRYVSTRVRFYKQRKEIVGVMQKFMQLAANLLRQERTSLPNLRAEVEPILRRLLPNPSPDHMQQLENYFLGGGQGG